MRRSAEDDTRIETILEVLGEGGSAAIQGRRDPSGGWSYAVRTNEAAGRNLLDPEDQHQPVVGNSADPASIRWTHSWDEALSQFDRYPWHRLNPRRVHPEFLDRVTAALALKGVNTSKEAAWRRVLTEAGRIETNRDQRAVAFSPRYDAALLLSTLAHMTQTRKRTSVPYTAHVMHVARLLERAGLDENVVIAGLLHDVLEDLEPHDTALRQRFREVYLGIDWADEPKRFAYQVERLILEEFGPGVLKLVQAVSEQKEENGRKRDWKPRKTEQLQHLRGATPAVAALKCADALHNAASILRDMTGQSPDGARKVLLRFNASPDDILWYYGTVAALAGERLLEQHRFLAREAEETVRALEKEVDRACGPRDSFTGERPHPPGKTSGGIVLLSASGRRIYSLDQWRRFAPPARGDAQWKDLRSAKELARAWFDGVEPQLPGELLSAFQTCEPTSGVKVRTIFAERQTPLDRRGRGRQHDLLVHGTAGARKVVVGIEAKADESFGPAIGEYLDEAKAGNARRAAEGRQLSAVPDRIAELARQIFGRDIDDDIRLLRYQLLHATAAMTLERKQADCVALVVHEFVSDACDRRRMELNANDLVQFARALDRSISAASTGQLVGPFMRGFYLGKVTRELEEPERADNALK